MSTVAVGFFDGVHLGHRRILAGADRVLTFRNHPLSVLAPDRAPALIMSFEDRLAAIREIVACEVAALDFTPAFAALPPEEFLRRYLLREDGADVTVRCGANWRFGAGGAGTPDWLRAHGVGVEIADYAIFDGAPVSSTRIREALARGEIEAANAMLGRAFAVRGEITAGKGEGTKLGYPTVNYRPSALAPRLPSGAYAVRCGGAAAVANLGFAPTFGERAWRERTLEVHFLGEPVVSDRVEFLRFLRPERRFASTDELREQIAADITAAERCL